MPEVYELPGEIGLDYFMKKVKIIYQLDSMDCGPTCLSMIANVYGKKISLAHLREACFITKNGVNLLGISQAAESIGFDTISAKLTVEGLKNKKFPLPCILHWNQIHFVVLYGVKKSKLNGKWYFYIADPNHGKVKLDETDFKSIWTAGDKGIALLLEPTERFYKLDIVEEKNSVSYLFKYLKPFKRKLIFIFATLLLGSGLTLIFPFLTQRLVDDGITPGKMNIVVLVLLGQLALFFGGTVLEIVRNRLFLMIGNRININIIADFLGKLMLMPLKYFESKTVGDLSQRISDHRRIETFLTSQSILILFSLINFSVFFVVLAIYNWFLLLTFLGMTAFSIAWVLFFQNRRKKIDYHKFSVLADSQNITLEMITSMNEIKLNSFEDYKLNQWQKVQEKLFNLNIKVLNIDQLQLSGYDLLNNSKNIFITFMVAQLVIDGSLTLGAMLSVSYIIGELNAPINRLISFIRSLQDARLSFSRLNEIHTQPVEEYETDLDKITVTDTDPIHLKGVSFQYNGPKSPFALKNINLVIPRNKITAIVGASGSGKTTLIKLLLKYDKVTAGEIKVGSTKIQNISLETWRDHFGIVMQDGKIFSDSIERNIATSDEEIDEERLHRAIKVANLGQYIESLPMGVKTKIGDTGMGVSGGQKQRLLIARSVYKDSDFLFFDEATSSLDSENESVIMERLNSLFQGKTVIIVAHRLSTVKNADQIVVLDNGEIAEIGTHHQLVLNRSKYFNLVKNQLDLGD